MARIDMPPERLTYFERTVCYYSLPKIIQPVTVGLIFIYAACVAEAAWIFIYGVHWHNKVAEQYGRAGLLFIVAFGIAAFMLRALLNEIRSRRVLALARQFPDSTEGAGEVPDIFQTHILLRHPLHNRGDIYPCTDNEGTILYYVESTTSGCWKVMDPQDIEVLRVRVEAESRSFMLGNNLPSRMAVSVGDHEVARLYAGFSLKMATPYLECKLPDPQKYVILGSSIYRDKKLVGRTYYLHHSLYLDIVQADFNEGILGLFVTMT